MRDGVYNVPYSRNVKGNSHYSYATIRDYQFSSSLTQVGKRLASFFMFFSKWIISKPILGLLLNIDVTHIIYRPMNDDMNKNNTLAPNFDTWQV